MKDYEYGYSSLENNLVNYSHIFDSTISRIYFSYYRNTPTFMHKITIKWEDGTLSTLTMIDSDCYKVKYKYGFVKISELKVGSKSHFGWHNKKGIVVDKTVCISRPSYVFTLSDRIEVNGIMVKCKIPRLLRHTKQLSRINKRLVDPSWCLGMKHFL